MADYNVVVRFTGKIEYTVKDAASEKDAMAKAQALAEEETRLGALEDIDWDVKFAYK